MDWGGLLEDCLERPGGAARGLDHALRDLLLLLIVYCIYIEYV